MSTSATEISVLPEAVADDASSPLTPIRRSYDHTYPRARFRNLLAGLEEDHFHDWGDDGVVARVSLEGEEHGLYCDVMELVRHENERRRLEENSRRFVVAEHSVDAMVDDYVACLEEALHLPEPSGESPKQKS